MARDGRRGGSVPQLAGALCIALAVVLGVLECATAQVVEVATPAQLDEAITDTQAASQ